MLTEQFINLCGALIFQSNQKFTPSVYSDIYHILNFYKEENVPLDSRKKFKLVQTLSKLKVANKENDEILDSVLSTGHFSELHDYLNSLTTKTIPDNKIDGVIKNIVSKKLFSSLLKDIPVIEEYIKKINTSSFSSTDEMLKQWESIINQIGNKIGEEKRKESSSQVVDFNFFEDDYEPLLSMLEKKYSGKNVISTGYSQLDALMNGGFEASRLYVFGGASGDGKSVLLMNCFKNAVQRRREYNTEKEIYIYYTLENQMDESLERLNSCLFEMTTTDLKRNFQVERLSMKRKFVDWQMNSNSIAHATFFPATVTSTTDILNHLEKVKNRFRGRGVVKGIYIDYLDLLKSGQIFDLYRLEQGQVTIDLKVMAVTQQMPVITATQLNRGGYDQKAALSLTQMSESMKKVEHSDFVGILRSMIDEQASDNTSMIQTALGKMQLVIGKNRSGPKNKEVQFITDFSKFLIKERLRDEIPMMELPQALPFQV